MATRRVAVVTGAAQGIGRIYAQALAEDGMAVVVADLNEAGAKETADLIVAAGGEAISVAVDVSDRTSTLAMAERVRTEFGGADILVNNAAIYAGIKLDPVLTVDIDYWRKVFSVNLDGALLCSQALAPQMIERGWGRIVNQSSGAAYTGKGAHYGVSKLALIGLTQNFARELGPHGVTVNAIAPGPIMTEATQGVLPAEYVDTLVASLPVPKKVQPDVLLGALRYLISDGADWVTGQTLAVDGGLTMRI